jgi:hypothetical protein
MRRATLTHSFTSTVSEPSTPHSPGEENMDFPLETGLKLIFLFVLGSCALVLKFVLDSRRAGLSHIPGPFLARYTEGYGKSEYLSNSLRKTYGEVARIGPTTVAVFDPAAVPTIYGTSSRLNKVRTFVEPYICDPYHYRV